MPLKKLDPFINLTLQERYLIVSYFGAGQQGKLYNAIDTKDGDKEVIIKISPQIELNKKEYKVLNQLNKLSKPKSKLFPEVYDGGEFIIDEHIDDDSIMELSTQQGWSKDCLKKITKRHSFIVMEKLGKTLHHYFLMRDEGFSLKTVC